MPWMTQTEAAETLGCSIRTIRRRIRSNSLNTRREGRNVLVELDLEGPVFNAPLARSGTGSRAVSSVVRNPEGSDTLTAMAAAIEDNLAVLSECRQQLEGNTLRVRRSNRLGWLFAFGALAGLATLGWIYHQSTILHIVDLQQLEQGYAEREDRLDDTLAAGQARFLGETDALWTTLSHERFRLETAQDRSLSTAKQLAAMTAERDTISDERDRLAAERSQLTVNLREAEQKAELANTARAIWSAVEFAAQSIPTIEESYRLHQQLQLAEAKHARATAQMAGQFETELAATRGHSEGQRETLESSLEHERQTVAQLEDRIQIMAERLVSVSTDRGRLKLEHVRLESLVADLSTQLDDAKQAKRTPTNRNPAGRENVGDVHAPR